MKTRNMIRYEVKVVSPDRKQCISVGRYYATDEWDAIEVARSDNTEYRGWYWQATPCW